MSRRKEYLVTLPSLIWLVLFFLIPTIIVFTFAFKPFDMYGGIGPGWTLETFQSLFDYHYWVVIQRTLWISIIVTILCCTLSIPMGYYMSRASEKMKRTLLLLTVLPFWSSFIVRIFAWKSLLHPEGFIKKIMVSLYLVNENAILLYRPTAVVIAMVYSYLPFAILPIYTASERFDYQLIEAARDLGLNRFKAFIKIFIPGIRKGILTAFLIVFIPCLGAYVIPEVVGGHQSEMIGNTIVQRTFIDRNLPQASALSAVLGLVVLIPMVVIAILQMRPRKKVMTMRAKL